jgi:hypothetical protein
VVTVSTLAALLAPGVRNLRAPSDLEPALAGEVR